jgi:hypothetical protein
MLKVMKGSTVDAIRSAREDYLDLIDYLLLNPDWLITPCVVISWMDIPMSWFVEIPQRVVN